MNKVTIFNQDDRRWTFFGRDPDKLDNIIDTNQYLVEDGDEAFLVDPGGMELFPPFVAALSREIDLNNIKVIIASHQDPDTISSLYLWLDICPDVEILVPTPWQLFITHLSGGRDVSPIPDEGMTVPIGSRDIELVPAHYVHSSGNFSIYDPKAKILFSGDIGAALLPKEETNVFVKDFAAHVQYMEFFHKRWMPSMEAKARWVERVRKLDVRMICPQHGAIFKDDDVARFLDWFDELEVGIAI